MHNIENTIKNFYELNKGKNVLYKGVKGFYLVGYTSRYLILGSLNETLCVKDFTNMVHIENKEKYKSFRFAKLKHISLDENI